MTSRTDIEQFLLTTQVPTDRQQRIFTAVGHETLRRSNWMKSPDFEVFHPRDLETIFDLYDQHLFQGRCRALLGNFPIRFRISGRMTSAGGKTTQFAKRSAPEQKMYEITVAGSLLFDSFSNGQRRIRVCGHACDSPLAALQRIMEHEITHLIELLLWRESSCAAERFQSISRNFFGHLEYRHALVTPREKAHNIGIGVGAIVRFHFEGEQLQGRVNRITKRATVLVEGVRGRLFSDGKRYETFYIPLEMLELVKS